MILLVHKSLSRPDPQSDPPDHGNKHIFAGKLSKLTQEFFSYTQELESLKAYQEHVDTFHHLTDLLKEHNLPYHSIERGQPWPRGLFNTSASAGDGVGEIKAVLSLGGDGTLLEAASALTCYPHIPLISLRSSAYSLGQLCTAREDQLPQLIEYYLSSSLRVKARSTMRAIIASGTEIAASLGTEQATRNGQLRYTPVALNDILFINSRLGCTTRYLLRYAGGACGNHEPKLEKQMSSGVWIFTPTGATAAASVTRTELPRLADHQLGFVVRELNSCVPSSWSHSCPPDQPDDQKLRTGAFRPRAFSGDHSETRDEEDQGNTEKNLPGQTDNRNLWNLDELAFKSLSAESTLVIDGRDQVILSKGDVVVFQHAPAVLMAEKI